MEESTKDKKKKVGKYRFLFRFIRKTVVLILIIVCLLTFVFQIFRMTGNSMYPYVKDGDFCIFYRLDKIYLNDVVLYEDEKGKERIGRIVASGGQSVTFAEEGGYLVNDYQPIEENPYETYKAEKGKVNYPLLLKEDEYFILNDFRQITTDSRELGGIKKSQIKGKLLFLMRRRNF